MMRTSAQPHSHTTRAANSIQKTIAAAFLGIALAGNTGADNSQYAIKARDLALTSPALSAESTASPSLSYDSANSETRMAREVDGQSAPASIDSAVRNELDDTLRRHESYRRGSERNIAIDRGTRAQASSPMEIEHAVDDREQQNARDTRGTFYIEREARRHDPYSRSGLSTGQIDRAASAQELAQPEDTIRIEVRYPTAYGYQYANGQGAFGDLGRYSCDAFGVTFLVAPQDPEQHGLVGFTSGLPMRKRNDSYVCEYVISNVPHDEPVTVRVAMSGHRTSASDVWLDGSQPRPGRQQRRSIADGERRVVLTANQPRAALTFEMVYAGAH